MSRLRRFVLRIVGLFVDDWPTTTALGVWLLLSALLLPKVSSLLAGAALFAGIAVILVASVVVAAREAAR